MTAVAYVVYLIHGQVRRVGPMPYEPAESFAKEVARRPNVTGVRLEEWACVNSREFVAPDKVA